LRKRAGDIGTAAFFDEKRAKGQCRCFGNRGQAQMGCDAARRIWNRLYQGRLRQGQKRDVEQRGNGAQGGMACLVVQRGEGSKIVAFQTGFGERPIQQGQNFVRRSLLAQPDTGDDAAGRQCIAYRQIADGIKLHVSPRA